MKMISSNCLIWMFTWLIVDVEAYKSGCSGGYCFVISDYTNENESLAQFNAQQRCRSNGTQLVEIRTKDIQNSLVNIFKSVYSQALNGWSVLTNGKRSAGNWIRLNGNGVGSLAVSDQRDVSYAYGYLKSPSSGFDLFGSRPTDNKGGFICTGLSDCSGGVTINGQCYKSFTETLSWYEARNRCLVGGGDLASFDHVTTNAGFNALNGSWINPSNSYWIGIRRESWIWQSSNSDVKYSEWITGHPLDQVSRPYTDCLCVSTTEWKWIECGCNQQLPFVCISDDNSTKTSTTTTSTTTRTTYSAASTSTSTTTFKGIGISTPTIQPLATSRSTPGVNESENTDKSKGLTSTEVGVAVGLGIGIPLTIVIVALAVVIVRLKKQHRKALLSLKTDHTTSSKNHIQQPVGSDIHELNGVSGDPYESLQPKTERTPDGLYQSLDRANRIDSSIPSSNI